MPNLELQIEEAAMQLTQQDLDALSAHSGWHAEHSFQLTPIPPGMEDKLQNMEKTKRIDKEKKKEIRKTKR